MATSATVPLPVRADEEALERLLNATSSDDDPDPDDLTGSVTAAEVAELRRLMTTASTADKARIGRRLAPLIATGKARGGRLAAPLAAADKADLKRLAGSQTSADEAGRGNLLATVISSEQAEFRHSLGSTSSLGDRKVRRLLAFSSADIGVDSRYSKIGARFAPMGSIDASGPLLAATLSSGTYRYVKRRRFVTGVSAGASLAVGYQIVRPYYGVAFFAGPIAEYRALVRPDPGNRDIGFLPAARVALDGWAKPLPGVLMTGYAHVESRRGAWYAKGFAGYEVRDGIFVGPEGAMTRDCDYSERQFGLGIVGLRARTYHAKLTAGLSRNSDDRAGRYLSVALWRRF